MSQDTAKPAHHVSIRHLLGVVAGALCIAFAPIFAVLSRRGEGAVGMWDSAFWRVFIGAIALGILFGLQRQRLIPRREEFQGGYTWLWLPGVVFAGDFWAWHWSFEHTSVANSTLLANTAILWVTLFAWIVWKERLTKVFTAGAMAAFAGMIILMLSSTTREPPAAGNPVVGDFLALLTAGFYAAYQLSMKFFRRQHSAPRLMFWASAVGAFVLFPLAYFHGDPLVPGSAMVWGALIGLGVLSHACGQGLIAYGLGGVPASLASVTLLVQPVATAFLGVWILGQPLVPLQIAGAVIVVTGLFFAIRGQVGAGRR
ncbi:MAG: EamA family transporter [Verrucomicrobiales bacterium]|nr:EamA family transporter [Verrucomicrobiales bacterium]